MNRKFLSFTVLNETYLIDVEHTVEIVKHREVTPVPGSDPDVLGLAYLRQRPVVIVDFTQYLSDQLKPDPEEGCFILLEYKGHQKAILVDDVGGIVDIDESSRETSPVTVPEGQRMVSHVIQSDEGLLQEIDVDKLFINTIDN